MNSVSVVHFQNVLASCFMLMDLLLLVHAEVGGVCYDNNTKPCEFEQASYIEPMHFCSSLMSSFDLSLPWEAAAQECMEFGGVLPEPNTEIKTKAFCEYAKALRKQSVWIGLSYDEDIQDFMWSQNKMPIKNGYKPINQTSSGGRCVKVLVQDQCEWQRQSCNETLTFLCVMMSESMPGPPKISVDFNITGAPIVAGSPLSVTCEALLSTKGDLRIALILNSTIEFLSEKNHNGVNYKETLKYDKKDRCKRHASMSIIFNTTLDMDGKTVACVSYEEEVIQTCSRYDAYCNVAGTIKVTEKPESPEAPEEPEDPEEPEEPEDPIWKRWFLSLPLILIIILLLVSTVLRKLRNRESMSTTTYTVTADSGSKYESTTISSTTEATTETVTDD